MNSRERVALALKHRPADRIPIDFWASESMIGILEQRLGLSHEQFLDRHDVDFRYIAGPRYIGPPLPPGQDIWGVKRVTVEVPLKSGVETYKETLESPLAAAESAEDIERYPRWPSPDWFDYSVVQAQCAAIRARGRVVVFMGDRLNRIAQLKPAMYLRGVEAILTDMVVNKDLAAAIISRIRRFYLEYLGRILEAARGGIDIVLTGDDFGSQNGALVSPAMWRSYLGTGFAEFVRLIKSRGAAAMHHTCGSVTELIPDMIECGLDILQSLQPEARDMSLAALKAQFGKRLCFQGGISIQQAMPFGTPDDIRLAVRNIADTFRADGGYIFCTSHNIQADTPIGNVLALLDAYAEFGGQRS